MRREVHFLEALNVHQPHEHDLNKQFLTFVRASQAGKVAFAIVAVLDCCKYCILFLGFASLALVYALANVMDAGWAALIVAVLWGIAAGALAFVGRAKMRDVSPKPERTIETLKEDAQWAKHPRR